MEIKSNTTQVITANDNFASLEDISINHYLYQFSISVNKPTIFAMTANQLIVRTYQDNPKSSVALSIFDKANNQTLNVLSQGSANLINNIKNRSNKAFVGISDTRKSYLTYHCHSLEYLVQKFSNGMGYSVIGTAEDIAIKNNIYSVPNSINQEQLNEDRAPSQLNIELLEEYKTDPASIITRIYSAQTPYETNNGCNKEQYYLTKTEEYTNQAKQITQHLLHENFAESISKISIQTYDISTQDTIKVNVEQALPIESVGSADFYVMFSVYDINNNLVQEFVKHVAHSKNIGLFTRIKTPPIINVNKKDDGTVEIFLQQTDKNATGVKIYKTVFTETVEPLDAKQDFVGSYELVYGNVLKRTFTTEHLGFVLYRALSYNAFGDVSSDFSSQVVENKTESIDGSPRPNVFISLTHESTLGGINLIISEITNNISIIKLYKTNLTVDPDKEFLIETFFIGGATQNTSFLYFDNNMEQYKNYSYRCIIIDNKGQEFDCTGVEEIFYRPVTQDYAAVTITAPVISNVQFLSQGSQAYDVTFTIDYAINKKLEDNLKEILTKQGLIEYYGGDIKRERLKDLLVTKVELRDLDSNEKSFLVYTADVFTQSKTKYGYITKNSRYAYELTTYVRSPATLLQSVVLTGSSTARSGGKNYSSSYVYKPSVFDHPFALSQGTNPKNSGDEFVENFGLNQFAFGDITSIDYVKIDLKEPNSSLSSLKAFLYNSQNVQLAWSVNGNQDEISHFVIKRQNIDTGKLDIIGKAHGINSQNTFTYIDPVRYTEVGVFRYIIIMQYFNMTFSQDYISNEVVIA